MKKNSDKDTSLNTMHASSGDNNNRNNDDNDDEDITFDLDLDEKEVLQFYSNE